MQDWVLALAGSPWLLLAVWAMATVDGVLPPIPSESVVLAVAVIAAAEGSPALYLLVLVAGLGAFCGDLIAYTIGRRLSLRRFWLFRSARAQRSLDWAEGALRARGASFILTARFVPVARVAVNMTAGATRFPVGRYVPTAALAGMVWAGYITALGVGAGSALGEQPLLAILVGIAIGALVGSVIDAAVGRRLARPPGGVNAEPPAASSGEAARADCRPGECRTE